MHVRQGGEPHSRAGSGSLAVTWSYDNAYQLTGEHRTGTSAYRDTYTCDPAGNRLLKNHDTARTTYAYDAANQLTYSEHASRRTIFAFDADGLMVKLEESTGTKTFAWDDQNYLGETDASNDSQVVYTNEPQAYGNLVSQRRGSTSHWHPFDAMGSTRELTDASKVVTDTRLYDASGNENSGLTDVRNNVIYYWSFNNAYGGERWPRN